jgi:hypothetical protein
MRKSTVLFTAMVIAATVALGADFSGKWNGNLTTDAGHTILGYFVLRQNGDELSGTAGAHRGRQIAINSGHVRGDEASIEAKPGGSTRRFVLRLQDGKLTGEVFEDGQRIGSAIFPRAEE